MEIELSQNKKMGLGKIMFVVLVGLLLVGGAYYASKNLFMDSSKPSAVKQMSFSVVSSPDKLEFTLGVQADKIVAIKITSTGQAKEQVSFSLKDILQSGKSVMSQGVLRAGFAPAIVEPKDFSKGAGLIVSATKNAQQGEYVIVYRIKTISAIEKEFTFPVTVK